VFDEVGAIAGNGMEMGAVRQRVVLEYESVILFGSGLNLEAINRSVIGRTDKLIPVSTRSISIGQVGSYALQMVAAIAIAKEGDQFGIGKQRHVFRIFHRI